jgi:hypothetical protein
MAEKMIRTPKEWDETCGTCRGAGTVHKREHFALWTPDEYVAHMGPEYVQSKLDPKHDVPANAVVCSAVGGGSIFEACKEGVALARAYGRPVAFEFNDAVAICHADADPEDVAKRWWKRAYGKTYEQSAADR